MLLTKWLAVLRDRFATRAQAWVFKPSRGPHPSFLLDGQHRSLQPAYAWRAASAQQRWNRRRRMP